MAISVAGRDKPVEGIIAVFSPNPIHFKQRYQMIVMPPVVDAGAAAAAGVGLGWGRIDSTTIYCYLLLSRTSIGCCWLLWSSFVLFFCVVAFWKWGKIRRRKRGTAPALIPGRGDSTSIDSKD